MSDYNFGTTAKIILRLLYSLAFALYMLLGAALIHNSWRYLYRARLGSAMVIMFYILSGYLVFVHMIFYLILTIDPTQSPYLFQKSGFTFIEFLELTGNVSLLCIDWLIGTTMYHLMLTIKVIFKLMPLEVSIRRKRCCSITTIIWLSIQLTFFILIPFILPADLDIRSLFVSDALIIFYFVLSISFFTITFQLRSTLKSMNQFGDFN